MTANLTCTQVSALLAFYLEDKLSTQLKQFVEAHLKICPTCSAKYDALKDMVKSLKEVHERLALIKSDEVVAVEASQYDEFKLNLSAYVDNELSDAENIKVKKYVISNAKARQDLEKLYNLKKVLHNSFERSKHDVKGDYSRAILKRIDIQEEIYGPDSFARVVALFICFFGFFMIAAVLIFWV